MNVTQWNANYKLAAGLALALLLWMASGLVSVKKDEEKKKAEQSGGPAPFFVQVKESVAVPYRRPTYVRARTEANRSVMVAAQIDGQVIATPATEGSLVKQGDPLCVLESQDRRLRLEQAKAQLNKAEIDYQGALSLKNKGYQSKIQIAAAQAELSLAKAELKASELASEKLDIRAPFDGFVQTRHIEVGGFLQRGSVCARLIELSPLVVVGQVPESDIALLDVGDEAQVSFAGGQSQKGLVRYASRASESSTRTFKVEVEINNDALALADGLSADMTIYSHEVSAHLVNPSLLGLKSEGSVGLKILDNQQQVQFVDVNVLGDDDNGVWVTGLPERVTIITVGQEYVAPGSRANISNIDTGADVTSESSL